MSSTLNLAIAGKPLIRYLNSSVRTWLREASQGTIYEEEVLPCTIKTSCSDLSDADAKRASSGGKPFLFDVLQGTEKTNQRRVGTTSGFTEVSSPGTSPRDHNPQGGGPMCGILSKRRKPCTQPASTCRYHGPQDLRYQSRNQFTVNSAVSAKKGNFRRSKGPAGEFNESEGEGANDQDEDEELEIQDEDDIADPRGDSKKPRGSLKWSRQIGKVRDDLQINTSGIQEEAHDEDADSMLDLEGMDGEDAAYEMEEDIEEEEYEERYGRFQQHLVHKAIPNWMYMDDRYREFCVDHSSDALLQ